MNENENKSSRQKFQETDVTIDLSVCMKWYIRIPQCKVKTEQK